MGGLCFIAVIVLCSCCLLFNSELDLKLKLISALVLAVAALCGLVGFLDDFGKITSRSNKGISGFIRLAFEFALGLGLGLGLLCLQAPVTELISGVTTVGGGDVCAVLWFSLDKFGGPIAAVLLSSFIVAATSNALNLHDGMDGLAAGTSIQVFATLSFMLSAIHQWGLACIAATVCGALLAFLIFNRHPAKVFMGDTGSLFLGALMAALVLASGLTLWLIPLGLIYIIETLSVMAQVSYFKLTKPYTPEKPMSSVALCLFKLTRRLPGQGKRLFRMAPLHHHFEALGLERGIPEWQVVIYFWLCQLGICLLSCFLFLHPLGH